MNSAAAYRYKRSDLLRRYPHAVMSGRPEADQSRSKALCIMNFRSFSMFDLVDPLSSRESIRDSRSKDSRKNSHRCLSLSDVRKDGEEGSHGRRKPTAAVSGISGVHFCGMTEHDILSPEKLVCIIARRFYPRQWGN